LKLIFDMF